MQEVENKNIIEVKDLSFSYGTNEILCDINLSIPKGDYLGIIGPNGAGKTTLLKLILGLLKLQHGTIRLFGQNLSEFKNWGKIGYVPQKVTNFDPNFPATVFEIVLMGRLGRRGLFRALTAEDRRAAKAALEEVGMEKYHDRLIGNLSGGQQQRVFIARALATEPEIIFLDEPTVGIDPASREEFYTLLKKFNKEKQLTLVLISHDIETITKEVEHVVCIDRALVCHTTPQEFLKDAQSNAVLGREIKIMAQGHHH